MFDRPINRSLWTIVAIILCIILLGVAAGVLAMNRRDRALTLIRVPDDYPTIQAAINAARPASIIQVRAGIYNENLIIDRPITLTAETFDQANPANNTTVINGGTAAATITIAPNLTQIPSIRGFVIQGSNNGIIASSPFIVDFNFFHSSGIAVNYQWGSGGSNSNNLYFKSTNDAIHLEAIDRPVLIENNRIMYAGNDGIEVSLTDKPYPPAPTDIDIWNNMIIGSTQDAIQLVDFPNEPADTNRRIVVVGNLLANSQKAGIGLMPNANPIEDFSGAPVVEAVRVYNNTFYGNNHGISGGANLVAFNNIVVNSTGRGSWRVQGPPGSNSMVAYTLFFNNVVDADQSTLGPGDFTGQDPLFVAAPNPGPDGMWGTVDDDFSGLLLQPGSPAIDKGVAQYRAANGELIPSTPLTGFTGAAPDLGWREYGSPIMITPTVSPIPSPTFAISPTPIILPTMTFTPITPTNPPPTVTFTPLPTMTPAIPTPNLPTITFTPTFLPTVTLTPAAAQLSVLGITPNSGVADTTVNLTISGTGFANGAVITFEGAQGKAPQVTGIQVVNANTIVITVNTAVDTSFGTQVWNVRVTNPNNTFAVLTHGFTIIVSP